MMIKKRLKAVFAAGLILIITATSIQAWAQHAEAGQIQGTVYALVDSSQLPGVTIRVLPADKTIQTNGKGNFTIPSGIGNRQNKTLIFSYPGMRTDTVHIKAGHTPTIELYLINNKETRLDAIKIEGRIKTTEMNMLSMDNMQNISSQELLKAACCNLSQSFETLPSVDVGFTDAVTGYRTIRLLGLAGANTAFTRESIPDARGLAAVTGLTFTPGLWVESMQLSKGVGSVVNGYEGIAGQINVEWWKPFMDKTPTWYLNAYQDVQGRSEVNAIYSHALNSSLSTNVFVNGSSTWRKNDVNDDGFLDRPMGPTFIGANRWFWFGKNGLEIQAGVKGVYLDHTGGQLNYDKDEAISNQKPWGYHQNLKRIEGWAKIGKVYKAQPWKSFGLQLSGAYHEQSSQYGLRNYTGKENSVYANFIYQTMLYNTNHTLKTGASFKDNVVNENFVGMPYQHNEIVPGAFVEYSYSYLKKFGLVAGLRADYSNLYGFFVTPRLHVRYAPVKNTVLRISGGRAQRTVALFAENAGYMASSRKFIIQGGNGDGAYGLDPEVAWNMGISLLQNFRLNYRDGSVMVDYFYTHFQNQMIVDIEHPREVRFYNLQGQSFAHSFQTQLDYEPIRKWDVRLAYRYYLIKTDYDGILKQKPLISTQRAFFNTSYDTRRNWKFDYTLKWNGKKRIPEYFLKGDLVAGHYSPDFFTMNAQITKSWKKSGIDWYIGVNNITNYMQPDIILDAAHPYQQDFDASMVWGPGMGRNIYTGIRWKIK